MKLNYFSKYYEIISTHILTVNLCFRSKVLIDAKLEVKVYTEEITKLNDHRLFAVRVRNIADISNTRKKIITSSISASFLIESIEIFVYNQ